MASYSQIACVGTGLSAIALGATLKRWYDLEDIRFFERENDCGGTWYVNSYPGLLVVTPPLLMQPGVSLTESQDVPVISLLHCIAFPLP